jgi:predicted dehydrogenase
MKPRLGFLGTGWIGRHRLQSVAQANTAEIAVLADAVEENLRAAQQIAPRAKTAGSLDDLFAHDLDGIVIATPSALHAEQAVQALERGIPVFCQKPLARTGQEVSQVISAAREADRLLGVDLSYRHVRGLIAIRELILRGELGKVFAVDLVFHNAYGPGKPWFYDRAQSGGGCVIDLGIHLVDAAMWILRSPVARVSSKLFAEGQPLSPGAQQIEDFAQAQLEMESGAQVHLACSWKLHAGQDAVIEASFYGTEGGASLHNIGGSFTEFRTEFFKATHRQILAEPPDPWGGGAILAWVDRLRDSRRFDRTIETHEEVARVLDAIYGEPLLTPAIL